MILVPCCKRFWSLSRDANTLEDSLDKLRSLIMSFRLCWSNSSSMEEHTVFAIINNISKFFVIMLLLVWMFINEEIRQLIKLRNRNISTMSYWSNCWRKTFVTQRFALLFIYPCHVYRKEVTVINMICRLPPKHWYTKSHLVPLVHCLTRSTHILQTTWGAHGLSWPPNFIPKYAQYAFHTKSLIDFLLSTVLYSPQM